MGLLCRWFLLEVVLLYCWLFQWVLSHQVEMISFYRILLLFVSAWSGRRRYRAIRLCMLKLVWNFNTSDRFPLVGCGLLLRCKRVVSIYCWCFLFVFLWLFDFWGDETFAYWAPSSGKIWNFLRAFDVIGRLHYGWMIYWGGVFSCRFLVISAIFIR